MNSPYRVHPALPSQAEAQSIPFPKSTTAPAVPHKLVLLVKLEGEIRQKENQAAVVFHALNEARELLEFEQGFFFRRNHRNGFGCEAVTNVANVDMHAPLTAAMSRIVTRLSEPEKVLAFSLSKILKTSQYPLGDALWIPLLDKQGKAFAGFLLNRIGPWTDENTSIAKRVGEAYSHGLRVHAPPQLLRSLSFPKWALHGVPLAALLLAFLPLPLTTLAPFEVVPLNPVPVTSPIDGAVASITSDPNQIVKKGEVLLRLDSTLQRADADIATQKLAVANARLETARNGAFSDSEMKRSLNVVEREKDLAQAELDYARSLLLRTEIVAPDAGLLIFTSKADWAGKPVRTGERIMEIADPAHVAYQIDLAVHDAIALDNGASVRLFFDADPLYPRSALLYEESYHATEKAGGVLSYTLRARPKDDLPPPRIGLRGTAQMSGEWVSLGFYLLRRPIAAARQYVGL
jgi:Biotin-lipoyl like/HlyD family secretion protein